MLVAIRENEQRARFLGYPTNRYKLLAFVLSAAITGLAGMLLLFQQPHDLGRSDLGVVLRRSAGDGRDRRHAQLPRPRARRAVLHPVPRISVGIYTENWLFWFGLVFVAFIVFSPTGLVGVGERLMAPFRKKTVEDAAMAARRIEVLPLPEFLRPKSHVDGAVLAARHIVKSFGGIRAVQGVDIAVADRTLHALIGPNGAGKTTAFNLLSGMYRAGPGHGRRCWASRSPACAGGHRARRHRPLVPDHQSVSGAQRRRKHPPRRAGAASPPLRSPGTDALSIDAINAETDAVIRYLGLAGIEARRGRHRCPMAASACSTWALALATAPRVLLLDEPLAGLAAAERERIGAIIKRISSDLPVLLVEHDIDRVFQLADQVTVMNEGQVLLDGIGRGRPRQRQGAGGLYRLGRDAKSPRKPRETAARVNALLTVEQCRHVLRQEPHPQRCQSSRCTRTRSSRCSAATAPASRRC